MFGFWYNMTFFSLVWLIICNVVGLSWLTFYAGYFLIIAEAMIFDIKRSEAK
jgi:hypothetical protein